MLCCVLVCVLRWLCCGVWDVFFVCTLVLCAHVFVCGKTYPCVRSQHLRVRSGRLHVPTTAGLMWVPRGDFSFLSSPLSSPSVFLLSLSLSLFFLLFPLFSILLYPPQHLLFLYTLRKNQTDKWLYQLRTAMHHAIH